MNAAKPNLDSSLTRRRCPHPRATGNAIVGVLGEFCVHAAYCTCRCPRRKPSDPLAATTAELFPDEYDPRGFPALVVQEIADALDPNLLDAAYIALVQLPQNDTQLAYKRLLDLLGFALALMSPKFNHEETPEL